MCAQPCMLVPLCCRLVSHLNKLPRNQPVFLSLTLTHTPTLSLSLSLYFILDIIVWCLIALRLSRETTTQTHAHARTQQRHTSNKKTGKNKQTQQRVCGFCTRLCTATTVRIRNTERRCVGQKERDKATNQKKKRKKRGGGEGKEEGRHTGEREGGVYLLVIILTNSS